MKDLVKGTLLAKRYRVLSPIGTGTTGSVYTIEPLFNPQKKMAAKVLFPGLAHQEAAFAEFRSQFVRTFNLKSPHLVEIYEAFRDEDYVGYAFEYGTKGNFFSVLAELAESSLATKLQLLQSLALSISLIHSRGFMHRGIKPTNVIFFEDGSLKLADCGLSYVLSKGAMYGTREEFLRPLLPYLSPEYLTHGHLDSRSDIYAFGVLGYELLTGRLPFSAQISELFETGAREDILSLKIFLTNETQEVEDILLKALLTNPAKRTQGMDTIVTQLQAVLRKVDPQKKEFNEKASIQREYVNEVRELQRPESVVLQLDDETYGNNSVRKRKGRGGTMYWRNGIRGILEDN